ncbi:sialate O-acetylesterase [Opitutaceae bacterium TAV4]|nr:sialate O-acetylesterase [Opitutaceae bacterium TAV4]RRJ99688.1 sialate O-acetylesterase [Opitutaceae bacterium TAV3]
MKITSGLAEGQVLQRLGQRGASALLSGETTATGPVFATLASAGEKKQAPVRGWKNIRAGAAARGRFTVTLKNIPAGGPYTLTLTIGAAAAKSAASAASVQTRIRSFYVGDVWLLAGQSNMEGCGFMDSPHRARPHPLIRAFTMAREWRQAADPLHIRWESPDSCHNDGATWDRTRAEQHRRTALRGAGVGLPFAHEMLARSGVPQALVCTAHGGTSMEQWNPLHKKLGGGSLYGSMLLSMRATGQPCAGVLWYQGESDTAAPLAAIYTDRMKKLVAATRRDLRQPDLPWIIVQLGRVLGIRQETGWNSVQEQQRLLPKKIQNLDTVVAIDLTLDDRIHISTDAFPRLARRMARVADRLVYRNRREQPPPRWRSISPLKVEKTTGAGRIDIAFDHVPGGLRVVGSAGNPDGIAPEPHGFALVDAAGLPLPFIYKTTLHGDTATIHIAPGVALSEVRLAYGPGNAPICNITDARDCALPVFGPIRLAQQKALLPFVTQWRKTPVIAAPAAPLARLACPDVTAAPVVSYAADGFINEHLQWQGKSGHCYFAATLDLAEPMKLDVLTGYDGPFRLWIDGAPFYDALDGINPCFPDEGSKTVRLTVGAHTLTVAMDLNNGAAWGFFLRFCRRDVTQAQLKIGAYARPVYGV